MLKLKVLQNNLNHINGREKIIEFKKILELTNVKGTIVGYIMPEHLKSITFLLHHYHFITEDKKYGGHLLDCHITDGIIEIDYKHNFKLILPKNNQEYYNADISNASECFTAILKKLIINN